MRLTIPITHFVLANVFTHKTEMLRSLKVAFPSLANTPQFPSVLMRRNATIQQGQRPAKLDPGVARQGARR